MVSWSKAGLGAVAVAGAIGADDRDEYARCVAERQPYVGLDERELVRRLGKPNERSRAELRWWLSADDAFGMKIDRLVIRYDAHRGAGPARFDPGA